jgi:Glycerophosphoryl diester phosphodiesterase family
VGSPNWLVSSPIAHRGLHDESAGRPENSLSAFRQAAAWGIPIELDVQLAADKLPIVIHDANVERVAGEQIRVANLTRSDLKRLRLGASGEKIPSLADALTVVDGRVPIVLDLRDWNRSGTDELVDAVLDQIRDYAGPLALQSFDPRIVSRLKRGLRRWPAGVRPVGQVSGLLKSAGQITAAVGRTMITNFLTHPDYISYELEALPSRYARYWRERRHLPLIVFTARTIEDQDNAGKFGDNVFFEGYLPEAYQATKASMTLLGLSWDVDFRNQTSVRRNLTHHS